MIEIQKLVIPIILHFTKKKFQCKARASLQVTGTSKQAVSEQNAGLKLCKTKPCADDCTSA